MEDQKTPFVLPTDHPVIVEIRNRIAGKPTPETRLALSIEGGGMRAVISSGMCSALESYGISAAIFDEIYGSSAGSVIAAFFAAAQIRMGTPVFYEDITDKRFIRKSWPLVGKPPMNIEFLVYDVIVNSKPLNWKAAISGRKLRIIATDVDEAKSTTLGPPESKEELQAFLRASQTIPLIAGRPYKLGGQRFFDASISEAIPWETPVASGATHVLVLSSRPLGQSKAKSAATTALRKIWTYNTSDKLKSLAAQRVELSADRALTLKNMTLSPEEYGPFVYAICPQTGDVSPGQLEQSAEVLKSACASGFRAVARAFGRDEPKEFVTDSFFDRLER